MTSPDGNIFALMAVWRGALMFSLRRHRAYYDVIVMMMHDAMYKCRSETITLIFRGSKHPEYHFWFRVQQDLHNLYSRWHARHGISGSSSKMDIIVKELTQLHPTPSTHTHKELNITAQESVGYRSGTSTFQAWISGLQYNIAQHFHILRVKTNLVKLESHTEELLFATEY